MVETNGTSVEVADTIAAGFEKGAMATAAASPGSKVFPTNDRGPEDGGCGSLHQTPSSMETS